MYLVFYQLVGSGVEGLPTGIRQF